MRFKSVILLLLLIIKGRLDYVCSVPISPTSASGPFQTSIARVEACRSLAPPVDPNPQIIFHAEVYNDTSGTNLVRGNVTIKRNCINKKLKVKGYTWQHDRWKLSYFMGNLGCHSTFMPLIAFLTQIKYDQKNCIFYKFKVKVKNEQKFKQKEQYLKTSLRIELSREFHDFALGKTSIRGQYTFSGVNVNSTQHSFAKVQEYGRILWRHEYISQAGTVFCWDFETLVEPIPH